MDGCCVIEGVSSMALVGRLTELTMQCHAMYRQARSSILTRKHTRADQTASGALDGIRSLIFRYDMRILLIRHDIMRHG